MNVVVDCLGERRCMIGREAPLSLAAGDEHVKLVIPEVKKQQRCNVNRMSDTYDCHNTNRESQERCIVSNTM